MRNSDTSLPRAAHDVAPCRLSGLREKPSERGSSGLRRRVSDGTEPIELRRDDAVGQAAMRRPRSRRRLQAPLRMLVMVLMLAGAGQVPGESEHLRALELCAPVSREAFCALRTVATPSSRRQQLTNSYFAASEYPPTVTFSTRRNPRRADDTDGREMEPMSLLDAVARGHGWSSASPRHTGRHPLGRSADSFGASPRRPSCVAKARQPVGYGAASPLWRISTNDRPHRV